MDSLVLYHTQPHPHREIHPPGVSTPIIRPTPPSTLRVAWLLTTGD